MIIYLCCKYSSSAWFFPVAITKFYQCGWAVATSPRQCTSTVTRPLSSPTGLTRLPRLTTARCSRGTCWPTASGTQRPAAHCIRSCVNEPSPHQDQTLVTVSFFVVFFVCFCLFFLYIIQWLFKLYLFILLLLLLLKHLCIYV